LTISAPAGPPAASDLRGSQSPRILWVPPGVNTESGQEAVELAASCGLVLDPWQQLVLQHGLAERTDGKWAAFEVGVLVSRQNGKGAILEARALAGLFLFGERLILHSAHEFKTAQEAFRRIRALVEDTDDLRRLVKVVRTSHGEEGIELRSGQRLRFVARSTGSGRGFTGDCIILDEAYNLPDASIEALMPVVSARPNPQLWYTSSAADKDLAPCEPLARVRRRGIKGNDPGLAYFEWSIDPHTEYCPADCTAHDDPADVRSHARANPGMGIRISPEHIERERASMGDVGFARERLGVGNWPSSGADWAVIDQEAWDALADPLSQLADPVAFAVDVTWDRTFGAIAAAGRRPDGLLHLEVVEHKPGTAWIVPRLLELRARWNPCAIVVDGGGPAGFLVPQLEAAEVEVAKPSARDAGQACGGFYEAVTDKRSLRHCADPGLASALAGAQRRPLGDAWAWDRKGVSVDISPLVAVTHALWGFATRAHLGEPAYDALESIF
jgi:hypothetical protein